MLLLQSDTNCSHCYTCPFLRTSEGWERCKYWAFVNAEVPWAHKQTPKFRYSGNLQFKCWVTWFWRLPGCERLCEDFTPGKACLHLHCFGIFGTRQENKGQSHLRPWSPTSKIQNFLSQVPRPINSAGITTAVCRIKHCPPNFAGNLTSVKETKPVHRSKIEPGERAGWNQNYKCSLR